MQYYLKEVNGYKTCIEANMIFSISLEHSLHVIFMPDARQLLSNSFFIQVLQRREVLMNQE